MKRFQDVNLEQELLDGKVTVMGDDLLLEEAKKIISGCTREDVRTLKESGLGHAVEHMERINGDVRRISHLEQHRLFSERDVRRICSKYRLRCLSVEQYRGHVDPLAASKMREALSLDAGRGKKDDRAFFICAPASSFQLEQRPRDPLLFLKIRTPSPSDGGTGSSYYYLVHKWGTDLSWSRALWKAPLRNILTMSLTLFLPFIGLMAWGFAAALRAVSQSDDRAGEFTVLILVSVIGIAALAFAAAEHNSYSNWDNKFGD
ncbi:MAG: hypothetical protein OK454_03085 [Thaumarchaeota archaeon]|nr:hypothetical protein [Nitrososphaerota archaeon]